jgi:lipocalin-like protein
MRVWMSALVVGIAALVSTHPAAQRGDGGSADAGAVRAANNRFAGVWQLVGEDTRDGRGQIVARGPNAAGSRIGYIAYDPAGYMAVTLAFPARPKSAGRQPTPQEALAALSTYNSYWGSFTVNEGRAIVTHQTFGAVSPAFAGTNQERRFTIAGNRLTLQPPAATNGDQRTLTWERVPDLPNLTPTHRKLIGFWKLISFEGRDESGKLVLENPGQTGFIVYTSSGHVMVHMMQPYRRRNVGASPTPDETMATYRTYTSYFGPYTVNESEHFVVHHLASALNPNWTGSDFQRFVEFSGKRLILKAPVTKAANGRSVQMAVIWERLSD